MQVVSGGGLLWIYALIFTSLQLWGRLSASTSLPPLPVPTLDVYSRSKDSVVLNCKVPQGHHGFHFKLYRFRDMVDSKETTSGAEQVQFAVKIKEGNSSELFCCVYKDQGGRYSAMSPYLQLEDQKETDPTRSIPSLPPPVLSVEPPTGVVKRGDTLSFSCSVPALSSQSQSQSRHTNKPLTFFLLRTAERTGTTSVILQPQVSQISGPESQPGVFTVGPVSGGEEGEYTCIYQVSKRRRLVNSTVSNVVQITITEISPPSSPDLLGMDWPLVLGSFAAVVLFLCSAVLVVVAAHRKAKAAAEKKRKRKEAQFWTQIHAKDHVVDLTLRRASLTSQEWTGGDTETLSRSPFWNPLSTFTTPSHPIH
ncbi:uncharacterized protein LOC108875907 isoform X3 [Lates calcarifer]|uniref:Uncharacterized protein LOC108875907 isoform X3 n=1 Tax=Lates calcarifer TaxID=8187 RepID=A0AAJ8B5H6_LATCA|nr:uncharacterized protein LOC108875907 isoform X3 [Lates calcarifer]